jgi:subtilisin
MFGPDGPIQQDAAAPKSPAFRRRIDMPNPFRCGQQRSFATGLCLLLALTGAVHAAKPVPREVDVLIRYRKHPGHQQHVKIRDRGGKVRHSHRIVPAVAARVPVDSIAALLNDPDVDLIEPDVSIHISDLELDNTWGVRRIGAGFAHVEGQSGAGVRVAVLDTGIDDTHPDLDANVAGGWDFVNNDNDPMDDHGHGTHVAGTIGAEDDDYGVVGVAPGVELYALKVLDANGSGSFSNVIAAIDWCLANNIQVTNNSYGAGFHPGSIVEDAFARAAAAGIVMVAAAGNSGTSAGTGDTVSYPAHFDSVIAVAATSSNDTRPSFSSTGPTVELAAPGVGIPSTLPGGGYASWAGTSMASPHVAGVAALVIGAGMGDVNGNGLIGDDVRALLAATAIDLGVAGGDAWYGYGLVDAAAAVELALATAAPPPAPEPPPAPVAAEVHVAAIDYLLFGGKRNNKNLSATIAMADDYGAPVTGATLSVTIYRSGKVLRNTSGTTNADGRLTFTMNNAKAGTYSVLIRTVVADPLEWDGISPANSFVK